MDFYRAIEKHFDLGDCDDETGEPWSYFPREALGVLGMHLQSMQEDLQNGYALEVERDGEGIEMRYFQRALSWMIELAIEQKL